MKRIKFEKLNTRQKEIYNYQKVSSVLADYGYQTILLSDDWMGADFIALNFNGKDFLRVQLKGGFTIDKKYLNKDIHICFFDKKQKDWYLFPHDKIIKSKITEGYRKTRHYKEKGNFFINNIPTKLVKYLDKYKL